MILITGIVTYFYAKRELENTLTEKIKDDLSNKSYYFMSHIDIFLYEKLHDVINLGNDIHLDSKKGFLKDQFLEFETKHKVFSGISVYNSNHIEVYKTLLGKKVSKVTLRKLSAELDDKLYFMYYDKLDQNNLYFAVKISHRGMEEGMIVACIPSSYLYNVIREAQITLDLEETFHVDLVDHGGELIYSNYDKDNLLQRWDTHFSNIIQTFFDQKRHFNDEIYKDSNHIYYVSAEKGYKDFAGSGWYLLISIPEDDAYLAVDRLNHEITAVIVILLVLATIAGFFVSRYFSRPLKKLESLAAEFGEGNFDYKIDTPNSTEFSNLAIGMENMADQLKEKIGKEQKYNKVLYTKLKQVNEQKQEIETKQGLINSSLSYAQRIQHNILPSVNRVKSRELKFQVYNRPLHTVSGDCYVIEEVRNNRGEKCVFVAAIDCTGHGVPGAFMTIIANNLLHTIVKIEQELDPTQILKKLDDGVKETLHSDENDQPLRDGMDLSVCVFNLNDRSVKYAGAYRPLVQIRENDIFFLKGDKMSIGFKDELDTRGEFETHEILFKKGDRFVMFSDGITDQFGGPFGKKFTTKKLKSLMLLHCDKPDFHEQMIQEIETWKKGYDQLDDMLLMSIQIKV